MDKFDDTLYVSAPVNSLVEGIYRENKTLKQVMRNGDFGLGTFNDLDGELMLLGGKAYQITGDGRVNEPDKDACTPFACVTHFHEMLSEEINYNIEDFDRLMAMIKEIIPSKNMMYALWIDGDFESMTVRSVAKQDHYRPLAEVAKDQQLFMRNGISGTLAGFYTPDFLGSINVTGTHLHFLSDDRSYGGHLLNCKPIRMRIGIQILKSLKMDLPFSFEYLTADFARNVKEDLEVAEKMPKKAK